MIGVLAAQYGGYVYGSYGVAFAAIGGFTWWVMRKSRSLSAQVDDAKKYWH